MLSSNAGLQNITKINLEANTAILQGSLKLHKMFQFLDGVRPSGTDITQCLKQTNSGSLEFETSLILFDARYLI